MSISNYTELKSTIEDWLERDDLTSRVPDFIRLGESFLNTKLRGQRMIVRSRATAAGQYIGLPGDWREAVNIQRVADGHPLGYLTYHELDRYRQKVNASVILADKGPEFYSIIGRELELAPAPTATDTHEIEMVYYGSIPALSDVAPTNWLLTNYPDIYLYAALVHTAPFLREDERLATWGEMLGGLVRQFNEESDRVETSGAPLVMGHRSL